MSIGRRGSCEGQREVRSFILLLFLFIAGLSSEAIFSLVRYEGDTLRYNRNSKYPDCHA